MEHSYVSMSEREWTVRDGKMTVSRLSLALGFVAVVATTVCMTLGISSTKATTEMTTTMPKFVSTSMPTSAVRSAVPSRNSVVSMSHFSSVKVGSIKDKKNLATALRSMGLDVHVGDHQQVRGHDGETTEAAVIFKQKNGKDVGFRETKDGSLELVADLQFWSQALPVDAFLEKLTQRYALTTIRAATADAGFQLVNQNVQADGSIRVEVSKYPVKDTAVTTTVRKFINPSSSSSLSRGARQRVNAPKVTMSHFTKVKTSLKDKDMLVKTLTDMGAKVMLPEKGNELSEVHGYNGETETANMVITQPNGKDFGFKINNEGNYELVADLQFWDMAVPADVFLEKLTQRYALNTVTQASEAAGFQLVSAKNAVDGSIKIQVSKFKTSV